MTGFKRFFKWIQACIAVVALACPGGIAATQSMPSQPETQTSPDTYAVSLEQYDRYARWRLTGVDGRGAIVFGLRQDERIRDIQLDLSYRQSPALLEDLSHLNVRLNGQVVASLPLAAHNGNEPSKAKVTLPTSHLRPYNNLELQFIGHYTTDCENPLHPDLWLRIDNSSRLVFDVEKLELPDDLGMLPRPFFDSSDVRALDLAVVLGNATNTRLEAAGVVTSWLGALSGYRGARFTASSQLPQAGNAVVVLGSSESFAGLDLPLPVGPTVAMRANPNDPTGKLLIITGRDDDEIRRAAVSLALGGEVLSGAIATLKEMLVEPRKPYDAPGWLPTDRPVALGELLPTREFSVSGFEPAPIALGLRLPPDLSDWRTKSVPLKLWYRHSTREAEQGVLDIKVNQQDARRIELGTKDETIRRFFDMDDSAANKTVLLPLSLLGSEAGLQFQFLYPPPQQAECSGANADYRRSAIDPRSTIDLSGLLHHKAMPDLAAFGTSGFPFTRMADLSESVVILPASVGEHEISAFLSLMGTMGQITGYPATRVSVARDAAGVEDKDILLLESGPRSELLTEWSQYLPVPSRSSRSTSTEGDSLNARLSAFFESIGWGRSSPSAIVTPPSGGAYLAGFESPISSRRSVVVFAGADGASLRRSVDLLIFNEEQRGRLQGSLALIRDNRVVSLSDLKTYHVGSLGPLQTVLWFLSLQPLILFLLYLVAAVLFAVLLYLLLRARAQQRLRTGRPRSR